MKGGGLHGGVPYVNTSQTEAASEPTEAASEPVSPQGGRPSAKTAQSGQGGLTGLSVLGIESYRYIYVNIHIYVCVYK